jgi:hypothetical protein
MNTLTGADGVGGGRKQVFLYRGRRGYDEAGDDIERPGSISWLDEDRGIKAKLLVVSDHRGIAGDGRATVNWGGVGISISQRRGKTRARGGGAREEKS